MDFGPEADPERAVVSFYSIGLDFDDEIVLVRSDDAHWDSKGVGGGLEGDVIAPSRVS